MKRLDAQNAVAALLLGAITISLGLALATVMQVPVAPPIAALPLPVVNMAWGVLILFLVLRDIRAGYIAAMVLGAAVAGFPFIVFAEILGPAPPVRPAHFIGVASDLVFGIGLLIAGRLALRRRAEASSAF